MTIKFKDIRDEIEKALYESIRLVTIENESGFVLIEGFMSLTLRQEIKKEISLGGSSVPTVGIVGKTSGRIYTFALKAILPEVRI